VAVIDAKADPVCALGDHPGLRGRTALEPRNVNASLLSEGATPLGELPRALFDALG
jgi:hypothetical protein